MASSDLEKAASIVENAVGALDVQAIRALIEAHPDPAQAAQGLVDGLTPLFAGLAGKIRAEESETEKETFAHALDVIQEAAYGLIKNPAKKPRKTAPEIRKGIWFADLVRILDRLRSQSVSLRARDQRIYRLAYRDAIDTVVAKLRPMDKFQRDPDGTFRSWTPQMLADIIERLRP